MAVALLYFDMVDVSALYSNVLQRGVREHCVEIGEAFVALYGDVSELLEVGTV